LKLHRKILPRRTVNHIQIHVLLLGMIKIFVLFTVRMAMDGYAVYLNTIQNPSFELLNRTVEKIAYSDSTLQP
jgi:high-affinity K+ transport system ATPase subunit B